jgi:hypothetical protein
VVAAREGAAQGSRDAMTETTWQVRLIQRGPSRPPEYLIIGAQKAGTTSLHAWLAEHPRVRIPRVKELHFFDHRPHGELSDYVCEFPDRPDGVLSGEATPYYLFHPLVPARVQRALPDIRLIVMLRDPVERAISHHNHETELGHEVLDLRTALAREETRLAGAEDQLRSSGRCFAHQHYSYVSRGLYLEQLERWWQVYDRSRIHVCLSEQLFADPRGELARICVFLGLEPHAPAALRPRNVRPHDAAPADVVAALRERFAEPNRRLAEALDRDLGWARL